MVRILDDTVVDVAALPRGDLERMAAAGDDVLECYRVLQKGGANIVGEILKGQGKFFEWNHYPDGDVYDGETHAQYYYHAHRPEDGEHGHFHTFVRAKGMPSGVNPVPYDGEEEWPKGDDRLSHLVAISMDPYGFPIRLFTTNRWVTGENWYAAADARLMLDRFLMDHAYPSWPVNRWISAMFGLYRPYMEVLLDTRDEVIAAWREAHPDRDVFEDRELEVTSVLPISVDDHLGKVRQALA
jgi:hypothetical protein